MGNLFFVTPIHKDKNILGEKKRQKKESLSVGGFLTHIRTTIIPSDSKTFYINKEIPVKSRIH